METIRQQYSSSVMSYITLSLASIIGVGLLTIFFSFWVTELADKDAQAINLSGSMRMQTYHVGLAIERGEQDKALELIETLEGTWKHPLFYQLRESNDSSDLDLFFEQAYHHWSEVLKPQFLTAAQSATSAPVDTQLIDKQVNLTDRLVRQFQESAEEKIRRLRLFQLLALLITVIVGSIIFYLLKNRVEKPLKQLTETAHRIGKGDFGHQVDIEGRDELALLGAVINQMSSSIHHMYEEMDDRVKRRTLELKRNNIALQFLYSTARRILDNHNQSLDFQSITDELAHITHGDIEMELCLFTAAGDHPYRQIQPGNKLKPCQKNSCENCHGHAPFCSLITDNYLLSEKFPIIRKDTHYGVLNIRSTKNHRLKPWQEQLFRSAADQFALALSLNEQKDQEHRLTMLTERTVIARELHDSLAQALSYLKIQVTRLQKSYDKERFDLQQPIIDELREGLSSAYQQLRELLTTFRLKVDSGGLRAALDNTVSELLERTSMAIKLDYQLSSIPLNPSEEIHLLQIVREAAQNAVKHSKGNQITISLEELPDHRVELKVRDNGIGIPDSPDKLNHYGLAIMNERARQLGGNVVIALHPEGGTLVTFNFRPDFLLEAS